MIPALKEFRDMHEASSREPAYEKRDVHVRPLFMFGGGLVLLSVIVLLLMGWMFGYFEVREARVDVPESPLLSQAGEPPPEPRLQVTPYDDLGLIRAEEETSLNSYGWVDRGAGIAKIPIERAMDLLTQKGLPTKGKEPRK
jgi:hypothetical protein